MYNITLIGTRHENNGKCNSDELLRILEHLDPEVIFEEKHPALFDDYYLNKSKSSLESNAIIRYGLVCKIKQVPVDSNDIPSDEFFKKHKYMHSKVEGLADQHGFNYRSYIDTIRSQTWEHGFRYLNSIYHSNACEAINEAIKGGLQKLNDDELFQILELWNEIIEKREMTMLQNIYEYSNQNQYEKAVFLIGAAHRKSIINKITGFQTENKIQLNWTF